MEEDKREGWKRGGLESSDCLNHGLHGLRGLHGEEKIGDRNPLLQKRKIRGKDGRRESHSTEKED